MEYKIVQGYKGHEVQDRINALAAEEWKVLTMAAYPDRIVVMMERDG